MSRLVLISILLAVLFLAICISKKKKYEECTENVVASSPIKFKNLRIENHVGPIKSTQQMGINFLIVPPVLMLFGIF